MERPANYQGVPMFKPKGRKELELDEAALKRILLDDRVKDKPVVVISVAGAFRKGKSFLLNFFIRCLRNKRKVDWYEDSGGRLDGFSWRGGWTPETVGIILWSEVFLVAGPEGEEVAVLLMDTQGTFDGKSTMKESATIFSLSTMLSSVQIYNVSQRIGDDDLQHLQFFCEYGKLAQKGVNDAPFQKLVFLVRDWSYPHHLGYGEEGGRKYLDDYLKISEDMDDELRTLREGVQASFEETECFLMPHPGPKVAEDPNFDGSLSDATSSFKEHLIDFVWSILHPKNLHPKRISSANITCQQLFILTQVYGEAFKKGNIPKPQSALEATATAMNAAALAESGAFYVRRMRELFVRANWLSEEEFSRRDMERREEALQMFDSASKMGSKDVEQQYRKTLIETIEKYSEGFAETNKDNKKNFEDSEREKKAEQERFEKKIAKYIADYEESERKRREERAAFEESEKKRMEEIVASEEYEKRKREEKAALEESERKARAETAALQKKIEEETAAFEQYKKKKEAERIERQENERKKKEEHRKNNIFARWREYLRSTPVGNFFANIGLDFGLKLLEDLI